VNCRILGPLEIESGGRLVRLAAGKQRTLFALLLLQDGRMVSSEQVIEELWGSEPPASARKIVHNLVSQVRGALREAGCERRLLTQGQAYQLRLEPGELDAEAFAGLLKGSRNALASGDYACAAELAGEALALWRGPPLADFRYEPFAQTEIARLEESQLLAREQRTEAELALGAASELVAELETLVAAHPLREALRAQLMLALYRSNRQAEALEVYRSTRRRLLDELGIDPSPALQHLEQAILRQDPSLRPASVPERLSPQAIARSGPGAADGDASAGPIPAERSRPVTVVLCEIAGAESAPTGVAGEDYFRRRHRLLDQAESAFARYGARVERSTGGSVVALFGVPAANEDDADRAVRSTLEACRAGAAAGLALRAAICSGEILVAETETGAVPVGGEAVDAAKRLTRRAAEDEVLLDFTTWRLVREAVQAEPLAPDAENERAFRLHGVVSDAPVPPRRADAPLVGRETELAQLRQAFRRCAAERSAFLFSVQGVAGIGKSRLAAEARIELLEGARVVEGRCLHYGEGITFWPLREMLVQLAGEPLGPGLEALLPSDPDRAEIVRSLAGLVGGGPVAVELDEAFDALGRFFQLLADERTLALVFEDIHWAEPALLDFIEHLVEVVCDAPIFVVCLARPELLEQRPGWGGGKRNATTILLDLLPETEAATVADRLLAETALPADAGAAALRLAEGNPLFLEQLLAFWAESTWVDGEPQLPPTISALLAARLDRLGPAERALLERAAVIGREFALTALDELVPPPLRATMRAHMKSLVQKELIRPARPTARARERYRFHHLLIRDAAYRGLAKQTRADLHERHATWLEANYDGADFADEIIGYHLEQAYCYQPEPTDHVESLGRRAAHHLARAGERASARRDTAAAEALLKRAGSLAQGARESEIA
jgi:DNA-binding SARP family transcriptional activator